MKILQGIDRSGRNRAMVVAALVFALGVGGCSDGAGGSAASSSVGVPSATAAAGGPSNAAEEQLHQNFLTGMAEYYHIDTPEVITPVRWVKPEERLLFQDPCVVKSGFTQSPSGEWTVPPDQKEAFELANYRCALQYPPIPKYTAQWADTQTKVLYEWTVGTEIPCLEAQGYTIINVPTVDVFVATYATAPFYPYEQVAKQAGSGNLTMTQLEKECPQIPPSELLYP